MFDVVASRCETRLRSRKAEEVEAKEKQMKRRLV